MAAISPLSPLNEFYTRSVESVLGGYLSGRLSLPEFDATYSSGYPSYEFEQALWWHRSDTVRLFGWVVKPGIIRCFVTPAMLLSRSKLTVLATWQALGKAEGLAPTAIDVTPSSFGRQIYVGDARFRLALAQPGLLGQICPVLGFQAVSFADRVRLWSAIAKRTLESRNEFISFVDFQDLVATRFVKRLTVMVRGKFRRLKFIRWIDTYLTSIREGILGFSLMTGISPPVSQPSSEKSDGVFAAYGHDGVIHANQFSRSYNEATVLPWSHKRGSDWCCSPCDSSA